MPLFYSFFWRSSIPLYICTTFFIHSSISGHLSGFHALTIVNGAAMNIGVHVSFWVKRVLSAYIPRRGIAGVCVHAQSVQLCPTLVTPGTVAHQASLSTGFPRQECWSGLPCPVPGDLPNLGIEARSLHCGWMLYCLSHQGSPRILEWVAYPFARGTSQPRNRTRVFCIAGGFFTSWATWEAQALS